MTPLKEKVSRLPDGPGIYLMKDRRGVVIYVGKAKSLRERVSAYFTPAPSDTRPKIPQMMGQVADVECVETESEVDALLMEARLIKDVQPAYNQRLRDDKSFPCLEITMGDDFPRVLITRYRDNKKSKYFGPFTDTRGLRKAVQLMQRVFRYCTCSMGIRADDPKLRYNRPCLLYSLRRCAAPCAGLLGKDEYRQTIRTFIRFLEGKRTRVLADLRKRMNAYSDALDYEKAGQARDQIAALEALSKRGLLDSFPEQAPPPIQDPREGLAALHKTLHLGKPPRTIEGVDVADLGGGEAVGSLVAFVDGKPFKSAYRRFRIKTVCAADDYAMIQEVIERRFKRLVREEEPFPDMLLIDGGLGHLRAALDRFRKLRIHPPPTVALAKKEELIYASEEGEPLRLKGNDPALRLLQYVRDEAHRFAQHYHHLLRRKAVLGEGA